MLQLTKKNIQTLVTKIFNSKIGVSPVTMNSFYEFKENIYNLRNKSCLKAENVRTVAYGIEPLMLVSAKL